MACIVRSISRLVCFVVLFAGAQAHAASVSGQLNKWYPIEIDFQGPLLQESSDGPNPFLDYRLTVTFVSPSGQTTQVPGFFAGDGQGGSRGQVWRARFSADEAGSWTYNAELRKGTQVAVSLDENAGSVEVLEGARGQINVAETSESAPGFLRHGRLEYVGRHYMKFRDGPYWIKGGTDSPENLLGFAGIDGTVDQGGNESDFLHDFQSHRTDWNEGDPLFSNSSTGADSRGLIGALNYLSDQGVNSVYFLPMNLGGDGQETFPFVAAGNSRYDKTHYDISKLYQWNLILNHAQERGIALNIVLSETEEANERWLDNGELGVERKLFFRELIARFGYLLAVKWNLGEENDFRLEELQKHADYIRALDWSRKPIAVHTHINQFYRYGEIVGDPRFSASSIQYTPEFAGQFVEQWRENSAAAGHPWVLDMDENTNGLGSEGVAERRKQILYDVLFSGGNIEWYFGSQPLPLGGDTTAGNFRLRENMWQQMRYAREMMQDELPFWRMQPADSLVSGDSSDYGGAEVFALSGEVYAVYLPNTNGAETLDISGTDALYDQRWFDPRSGTMHEGRTNLASSGRLDLGSPPFETGEDWVTIISRSGEATNPGDTPVGNDAPMFQAIPSPTLNVGESFSLTLTATDNDGTFPVVTVRSVPGGMQIAGLGNGRLKLDWTVPANAAEESIVELIAIDAVDRSIITLQRMTITVSAEEVQTPEEGETDVDGNSPSFAEVPTPTVQRGQQFNLRLQAYDSSGIAPSVTVGQVPGGMTVNGPGNGVLELAWQVPDSAPSEATVELIAIDPVDSSVRVTQVMTIRVEDGGDTQPDPSVGPPNLAQANAPELQNVGVQSVVVGQRLMLRIAADDVDGIPPALVILNMPDGANFSDNGDGTRTLDWLVSASDIGRNVMTIVARDHAFPSLSDSIEVVVEVSP